MEEPRLIPKAGVKEIGARGRAKGTKVITKIGAKGEATLVRLIIKAEVRI